MTLTQWLIFLGLIHVVHFLGTWKMYKAAGYAPVLALIPIYNALVLMRIINRPRWWVILLFIPIINLIMLPVIWVETLRSFGFNERSQNAYAILTLGFYLFYINYTQTLNHKKERSLMPRSSSGEWISSILFAVVAATLVHTYFMQPFTIPSSSLEKTLLVGDYLFVSKFHYGARTPMTSVSLPMVHDTIPLVGTKSYLSTPQLPYFRLPGFQDIKRNDIVVFNWPVDTLVDIRPGYMRGSVQKPIDKKSNYVKRCVGLPGDSLSVVDGYVYINGQQNNLPDRAKIQFVYEVVSKKPLIKVERGGRVFNEPNPVIYNRFKISDISFAGMDQSTGLIKQRAHMSEAVASQLESLSDVVSVTKIKNRAGNFDRSVFPYSVDYPNNNDYFGPIYIPAAGSTVAITPKTLPYYRRIIEVYEGRELGISQDIQVSGNEVLLNGNPITEYTFKMDYYWLMGDNRDNSQDARSWGFVPENHVIGKPVFIWLSLDANKKGFSKIRWERMFTTVGGSGEPKSYLSYFLIALAGYYGWDFWRKRKKKK
ncbi:signal peptidase I [Flavobacteriaceae bacterium]|nr:signal peptidase I [Flavobacteriaceae bacterium]